MLVGYPNHVTNAVGFYVSYNDHDQDIYGGTTTALVIGQMERFYILNGDHQRAYRDLISQGLDACLDYFRSQSVRINKRSDVLV